MFTRTRKAQDDRDAAVTYALNHGAGTAFAIARDQVAELHDELEAELATTYTRWGRRRIVGQLEVLEYVAAELTYNIDMVSAA